jgi:hypothetical protein
MRTYLRSFCEGIDAAVFNGDFMLNDDERAEFRVYLERWQRELVVNDKLAAEAHD